MPACLVVFHMGEVAFLVFLLVFLLIRALILSDQGPTLTTSFTLVVSTEALSPNTLEVKALMYDLRDIIQFIAIWKGSILPFNFLFSLCSHCFSFLCLLFSAFLWLI